MTTEDEIDEQIVNSLSDIFKRHGFDGTQSFFIGADVFDLINKHREKNIKLGEEKAKKEFIEWLDNCFRDKNNDLILEDEIHKKIIELKSGELK